MKNIIPIVTRTYDQIYQDVIVYLNKNTPVNVNNSTSTTRLIAEMISRVLANFYEDNADALNAPYISTAQGLHLDKIGELFGLERGEFMRAEAVGQNNMKFYIAEEVNSTVTDLIKLVPAGIKAANPTTFPSASSIVVKLGTTVSTSDGRTYLTSDNVTLSDASTSGYTGIIASDTGEDNNVGEGELTSHNLDEVQPELATILDYIRCTNEQPVTNGRNTETDDDFRLRIVKRAIAAANANRDAVRSAALEVPGVSDVILLPRTYGNGTYTVFVQSTAPVIENGTLSAVQAAVDNIKSFGERGYVSAPEYLGVMINIDLDLKPNAVESTIINDATEALVDYINNIEIGGTIYITEIIERVKAVSDNVRDMEISQFGYGTYNRDTGVLEDHVHLRTANQKADWDQKWFTKNSFCAVCRARTR